MAVDLFIQNVPEDLVARLQERAARSHRSLQEELLTVLVGRHSRIDGLRRVRCAHVLAPACAQRTLRTRQSCVDRLLEHAITESRRLTAREALAQVQALGLSTPSESAAWIREDRDAR
jgi:plasmid stability protein